MTEEEIAAFGRLYALCASHGWEEAADAVLGMAFDWEGNDDDDRPY